MPISLHLFFFIRYTAPLQAEIDFAAKRRRRRMRRRRRRRRRTHFWPF